MSREAAGRETRDRGHNPMTGEKRRKAQSMRTRLIAPIAATGLLAASVGLTALPASAAQTTTVPTSATSPLSGTATVAPAQINQTITNVGTFVGTFTPTKFTTQNGQLAVTGLVQGTFTTAAGATQAVSQTVTTVVTNATANNACTILTLDLGPLDLNLLGLQVQLNEVQLDITAVPGSGNLLGNLLCAVAGLLDQGQVSGLATLLNQLLGL